MRNQCFNLFQTVSNTQDFNANGVSTLFSIQDLPLSYFVLTPCSTESNEGYLIYLSLSRIHKCGKQDNVNTSDSV